MHFGKSSPGLRREHEPKEMQGGSERWCAQRGAPQSPDAQAGTRAGELNLREVGAGIHAWQGSAVSVLGLDTEDPWLQGSDSKSQIKVHVNLILWTDRYQFILKQSPNLIYKKRSVPTRY